MMIIANPHFKAQKAEIARSAHPPPLSYLWSLLSLRRLAPMHGRWALVYILSFLRYWYEFGFPLVSRRHSRAEGVSSASVFGFHDVIRDDLYILKYRIERLQNVVFKKNC